MQHILIDFQSFSLIAGEQTRHERDTTGSLKGGLMNAPRGLAYMWDSGLIKISLEDADANVAIIRIDTQAGVIKIAGTVFLGWARSAR